MADWTNLPPNVLDVIAQHLSVIEDFASFSAVCKECRLVTAILKKKASLPPRYPRLILSKYNCKDFEVSIRNFFNLSTRKTNRVQLPEAYGKNCVGVGYGWLVAFHINLINLLHPFSGQQICLPSRLTFPDKFECDDEFTPQMHQFDSDDDEFISPIEWFFDKSVRKVAISASPVKGNDLNDACVIVAIYGVDEILAFTRLGDTEWTHIQVSSDWFEDVVYYTNFFYVVDRYGDVVVCDIDNNNDPKATMIAHHPSTTYDFIQNYLVESSGDLLLVVRGRRYNEEGGRYKYDERGNYYYTTGFSIWKLVESRDEINNYDYKWTEVTTLGDRALFLGLNVSTSKASFGSIKANCIYFIDDYHQNEGADGHDTGIFNMEDGSIFNMEDWSIQLNYAGESVSLISPPLWYM